MVGTLGRGGAERQLAYILRILSSQAVDSRVLCLTSGQALQREIESLGIPVEWVGANPSKAARLTTIMTALRRKRADVVQSTHFFANAYAAVAASSIGVKSIGAVRGDLGEALKASSPLGLAGLFLPDYLVVNSQPAFRDAVRWGRSAARVMLLPNVVDTSRFKLDKPPSADATSETLRLLFVGRFTSEKRADRFLRLVQRLDGELVGRTVEARLVGDGPQRADLEDLRSALGLDSRRVQFMGESGDLAPLYEWADLLVLTSDHEGSPNVVLEAMALGLPVVATAVGDVPDLLSHGGGLMARPDSEDALLAAALKLATDGSLAGRLVSEGTRYVTRHRSLDSLWGRLDLVYKTVRQECSSSQVDQ